jgi:hypothetical protein
MTQGFSYFNLRDMTLGFGSGSTYGYRKLHGRQGLPVIFPGAEKGKTRFLEFFTVNIRDPNYVHGLDACCCLGFLFNRAARWIGICPKYLPSIPVYPCEVNILHGDC